MLLTNSSTAKPEEKQEERGSCQTLAATETNGGEVYKSKFILLIIFIFLLSISLEATYHKIGHSGEPYWAMDLELIDSTILVPDDAGIHIIDVSEPNNPIHLDCLEIKDTCRKIEVSGDIAYVANTTDGLLILDVNDPQSPQIMAASSMATAISKIAWE